VGDEPTPPFTTPAQSFSNSIVVRIEGYTYAAKVRALCIVQRSFSVAPCQTLLVRCRPRCVLKRVGAQMGVITKSLGKLEVIMKPLTEKVNTLSAELDLLKRSQRAAEDLMLGGLEKLEKDLRDKVNCPLPSLPSQAPRNVLGCSHFSTAVKLHGRVCGIC
jgi:hypothetical protein